MAASGSAAYINASLQYNYLEQKVNKNFDLFNLNACIADVDIKESTCKGGKSKKGWRIKKRGGLGQKEVFQNI